MLRCITIKSASSSSTRTTAASPATSGHGRERTPISSPTVNLSTREYTLAVQTKSFKKIWYQIHIPEEEEEDDQGEERDNIHQARQYQPQILHPDRECVDEALRHAMPNPTLTNLVSSYFTHSESTTNHCLHLHHSVDRATTNYAVIKNLIEDFPVDVNSLTKSQCKWAHEIFIKFDNDENPFPNSELHNFHEMRVYLTELKQQLDLWLGKSKTRKKVLRRANAGSAMCFLVTALAVAASAVTPALFCPTQPRLAKKELPQMAQLDAAYKGIFVLNTDLDTIDRLVASLYTAVEGDKSLVRIGLCGGERGKHSIFEVVKQLRKNQVNFRHQLNDLEQHICLCFVAINRARSLLLQEILDHQHSNS